MPLTTQLDITKIVTTTLAIPETFGVAQTTIGTISTQLGSITTSTIATVLATGLQGDKGDDGDSAYLVWLSVGNTGTEQDFLDSLVSNIAGPVGATGDKGDTGAQGATGPAGYTPVKGVDYFDGADGQDGATPVVTLVGDQISIDGDIQPTHLTGPAGSDSPLGEAPQDGKQYARKDGAWVEVVGGGDMATFDAALDFARGNIVATATIIDTTMTGTKIIQAFYQDALDEVAVLNMRVNERSRTNGVGFEIIGVAPNGAFGVYNVRCIVSGS